MRYLIILSLWFSFAFASHFTGTYSLSADSVTLTLILQHSENGTLLGELNGSGERLSLTGMTDSEGGYGEVTTSNGVLGFEAYLSEDDKLLGFYLFEMTASGEVDQDSVQELIFERQSHEANLGQTFASPAPSATPGTATAEGNNPLAPSPSANPLAPNNPLATTDPLLGTFSDSNVSLTLQTDGQRYSGQLEFNGQSYPVIAQGSAQALQGEFESGGNRFPFEATLQGSNLQFTTGGSLYSLEKQAVNAVPLAHFPTSPLTPNIKRPDPTSAILAKGQFAELSQDNALAFLEALEFSLVQVGFSYTFTDNDRQQVLQVLVQEYPQASKEDQLVLSQARDIWNRVQTNWTSSSQQDQHIFILGVLTLAFGEETVQQNLGQGSTSAGNVGSSGCDQIEDCMSKYNPEAYSDMVAAQGCWASAGCTDYDSSTDTYTYEDYSPTYDSYD